MLFLVCSSFCFAKQISFQIVQNNNFNGIRDEVYFLEDVLISRFFEEGYIATNLKASVADSIDYEKKLWKACVESAEDGGADYFVQVVMQFAESRNKIINQKEMILDKIKYSITDIESLDCHEGIIDCGVVINNPKNLTVVSNKLANEIISVLEG